MTKELAMQAARVGKNRKPFNYKIVPIGKSITKFIFYIKHPRYFKEPSFFVIKNHLLEWLESIPGECLPIYKIKHPWKHYRPERGYNITIIFEDNSEWEFRIEYVSKLPD